MNYAIISYKNVFHLKLFSPQASDFHLIQFIPSWHIFPQGEPDPYQSDLYQGYCDYVGAYYPELTFHHRIESLSRLHQYSQIPQYQNGCFLAERNWFTYLDLEKTPELQTEENLSLNSDLIALCQHELALHIGPIAQFILNKIFDKYLQIDCQQLIEVLASEIPELPTQALLSLAKLLDKKLNCQKEKPILHC